jgi:DNA invertase Pin-like site-specific DNA recombinase
MTSQSLQQAAIYGRVSTLTNQSTEMQVRDLRQLADRRGFEVLHEYLDEGFSGAKSSRPALDKMLADAKRGKFRILLVWKLDRLGRSLAHLVRLLEDLRACNVEFVSFSEGLDFTTTTGKLLYQMLSAFAEFERDCIRERVRAGMRKARAKGKRIGRPPRTQLSPEDRKSIAAAYWCQKASFRQLAKRFDTSIGTVQRCALAHQKVLLPPSTLDPI